METTVQNESNYPFTPEGKIESLEKKIKEVDSLLEDMSVPIEKLRAVNQVLEIIYHLAFKGDSWMLGTKQELLWAAYVRAENARIKLNRLQHTARGRECENENLIDEIDF